MKTFFVWTFLIISFFGSSLLASDISEHERVIKILISQVKKSDATFIRNGEEHSSQDAAEHLDGKWRRARTLLWFKTRQKEFTPEQFITHIASKSSYSGNAYQVKLKNGKTIPTETWLRDKLKRQLAKEKKHGKRQARSN